MLLQATVTTSASKRSATPDSAAELPAKRHKSGQDKHYERQLRRVLLGNDNDSDDNDYGDSHRHPNTSYSHDGDDEEPSRIMAFGPKPAKRHRYMEPVRLVFGAGTRNDDPYRQDILRARIAPNSSSSSMASSSARRTTPRVSGSPSGAGGRT